MEAALEGRRILLGVSAGIAAYKVPYLVRRLVERGATVRVVLTPAAKEFVTPLSLQAVSGLPVAMNMLDPAAEAAMGHIELARWADLVLIAPATADLLARLRAGVADDLLTTAVLASRAPLALAPAMNQQMWANSATQENTQVLAARGAKIWGPAEGQQACGDEGVGRMLEPDQLAECVTHLFHCPSPRLMGAKVLVSAGPTFEDLDPVRFLGNRSSGRMGFALAGAARAHGAEVTMVAGPVNLMTPPGVKRVDVRSAQQMHQAVLEHASSGCDLYIAAAAVADYRPQSEAMTKIKKRDGQDLSLELTQNPDILAAVAALEPGPFTLGFAAETDQVETFAMKKLKNKGVDLIAANRVGQKNSGFDADCNALTVLGPDTRVELPRQSKVSLAHRLLEHVADQMNKADRL